MIERRGGSSNPAKEKRESDLCRTRKPLRKEKNSTICDRFSEAQRMLHVLLQASWKSRDVGRTRSESFYC